MERSKIRIDIAILWAVYFPLAVAMYYFNTEYFRFGVAFMVKFLLAVILAALGFIIFLIRTNLTRMRLLMRYLGLLILPHLVVVVASMPLWVFQTQKMTMIRRGIFDQLYGIAIIFAMAGIVYVFGSRGFWLNMAAMLAANLITIVEIIWKNGFSAYWEELRTLVVTFAAETGELMTAAEVHELTFAIGLVIVACIVNWRQVLKSRPCLILLAAALFCFFSGFKRIGVGAMAVALVVWIVLGMLTLGRDNRHFWPVLAALFAAIMMFSYICMVKGGIFGYLTERFNLNTMGRAYLSELIGKHYWIGPDYFGNGAGFVNRLFSDLPSSATIRALHNDVLAIYIDIGFWGFWAWMLSYLPIRTWMICRWQGVYGGILCLCGCIFVLVTAMTDNTIYYVYVTGALSISIMSYRLEEMEMKLEKRLGNRAGPAEMRGQDA